MHIADQSSDRNKSFPFVVKNRLISTDAPPIAAAHEGDHALSGLGHRCEEKLGSINSEQAKALQSSGTDKADAPRSAGLPSEASMASVVHELKHTLQLIQQNAEILISCRTSRLSREAKSAADRILQLVMSQAPAPGDVSDNPCFKNGTSFFRR